MEKIKEIIYNDLELYFYLYRDKEKWELEVWPSYIDRARTSLDFFIEVLEEFCMESHLQITDRAKIGDTGMYFYIDKEDRSRLKPKNGIYDTCLTTKRQ